MIYVDNYREKFLDNLIILQLWRLAGGFFCLPTGKYIWRASSGTTKIFFCEKRIKSDLLAQAKFEFLQRICEKEIKKLTKNSETIVLSYNLYSHYSIRVLAFPPAPKTARISVYTVCFYQMSKH